MNQRSYPRLTIDLKKLHSNAERIVDQCRENGISVAGVIKGFSGIAECAEQMALAGCAQLASSRLEHLEGCRNAGIAAELLLIRVPMMSEAAYTVEVADMSLNSDIEVLKELNRQASLQGRVHKVILMADLGDLREGFWGNEELCRAAAMVENQLDNLYLAGVGTNLGCYGAVKYTQEKMQELVWAAEAVEKVIGRQLDIISGGNTFAYPRVLEEGMPDRINHMRIGELIMLARDLQDIWGYDMKHLYQDVFTLQAEIIETRDKPSHPIGEIMYDTLGNTPEYEDRGIRKRALLGIGRVDYVYTDQLIPLDKDIQVLGASSDHTVIDIQDSARDYKTGDIVGFYMFYGPLPYLTQSADVKKVFI